MIKTKTIFKLKTNNIEIVFFVYMTKENVKLLIMYIIY